MFNELYFVIYTSYYILLIDVIFLACRHGIMIASLTLRTCAYLNDDSKLESINIPAIGLEINHDVMPYELHHMLRVMNAFIQGLIDTVLLAIKTSMLITW